MNLLLSRKKSMLVCLMVLATQIVEAQFLMDMIDTTTSMGKGMLNMYSRFDRLRFGGYIQPQFQVAQTKGEKSFEGGDFSANSNSRFLLRRSRIRIDYIRSNKLLQTSMQFVFQFDATERGVNVRDVWARLFENKWQRFAFTTGVFARPFGYEINLSSADRESPERGRMSQTLMKTERDIGVMLTMEPRRKNDKLKYIKIDIGIFNGQGLNGPGEFDGFKDIIGRIGLKPFPISKKITFSAGASYLHGGIIQNTKYQYQMGFAGGNKTFLVDSSTSNIGKKNPRVYQGFDAQLKWKNKWGAAELRGEYWWGTQTAGASTNETPGILLAAGEGYYIRRFNGAFFYLLQNIINTHHQVGIKIDWFDPNTKVTAGEIGKSSINATNIKYTTYGMGYNYYINENLKVMLWYHVVNNEKTQLVGYTSDLHDNILTCRLQYRF